MKKSVIVVFVVLLLIVFSFGQGFNAFQQTTFTTVTTAQRMVENTVIGFHQLSWTVSGTVATCTVAVDSSPDDVTYTPGGIITGQTCTSNGNSSITAGTANFVRVNVTAISGAGATVVVTYKGWVQNPSGGGGSGTVSANNGIAGANAYYPAAAGSTTVNAASGLSYDAVGNATLAQGTITVSTPAFSQTGTWNAGGVAFTNWLSNITATAAAANSKLFDIQIGGADKMVYQSIGVNGGTPTLLLADTAGQANLSAVTASSSNGLEMQASNVNVISNATQAITFGRGNTNAGLITQVATGVVQWVASGTSVTGTVDTGLSRDAAGVIDVGNGTAANSAGVLKAAAFQGGGAAATLTGTGACATFGAQTGGSSVGQSSCASATAASTLTITPGTTAPNGWVCYVQDETTRANLFQQTSHTTTACTLTATSVTQNDVFVFSAMRY